MQCILGINKRFSRKAIVVKEYHLDVGIIQVFDDYIVCIFEEGSTVALEQAYQIIGISETHFKGKKFGYISLRKNAYGIDPAIYTYLRELDNLKALAIVSKKEIDMHNFKIEKIFYRKNIAFFIEYENAVSWVKKHLTKRKKSA